MQKKISPSELPPSLPEKHGAVVGGKNGGRVTVFHIDNGNSIRQFNVKGSGSPVEKRGKTAPVFIQTAESIDFV